MAQVFQEAKPEASLMCYTLLMVQTQGARVKDCDPSKGRQKPRRRISKLAASQHDWWLDPAQVPRSGVNCPVPSTSSSCTRGAWCASRLFLVQVRPHCDTARCNVCGPWMILHTANYFKFIVSKHWRWESKESDSKTRILLQISDN